MLHELGDRCVAHSLFIQFVSGPGIGAFYVFSWGGKPQIYLFLFPQTLLLKVEPRNTRQNRFN